MGFGSGVMTKVLMDRIEHSASPLEVGFGFEVDSASIELARKQGGRLAGDFRKLLVAQLPCTQVSISRPCLTCAIIS